MELLPACQALQDDVRKEMDDVVVKMLGLDMSGITMVKRCKRFIVLAVGKFIYQQFPLSLKLSPWRTQGAYSQK